jgi:hypothetical protein
MYNILLNASMFRRLKRLITRHRLTALTLLKKESRIEEIIENSTFIDSANPLDQLHAINLLVPIGCSKPMIRIGGKTDGAYLIPDDLKEIDACFSPGTSHEIGFEKELAESYNIDSYMCDASVDPESLDLSDSHYHFEPKWLGSFNDEGTQSLEHWVKNSSHSDANNLLLQMDIEGAEYSTILATPPSIIKKFRIVVIELHGLERLSNSRFLTKTFMPTMAKLLAYFDCVHAHANNCCGTSHLAGVDVPKVIELSFYRKECNVGPKQASIPHPLDIINDPWKPPLLLGAPWRNSNLQDDSSTKK